MASKSPVYQGLPPGPGNGCSPAADGACLGGLPRRCGACCGGWPHPYRSTDRTPCNPPLSSAGPLSLAADAVLPQLPAGRRVHGISQLFCARGRGASETALQAPPASPGLSSQTPPSGCGRYCRGKQIKSFSSFYTPPAPSAVGFQLSGILFCGPLHLISGSERPSPIQISLDKELTDKN